MPAAPGRVGEAHSGAWDRRHSWNGRGTFPAPDALAEGLAPDGARDSPRPAPYDSHQWVPSDKYRDKVKVGSVKVKICITHHTCVKDSMYSHLPTPC